MKLAPRYGEEGFWKFSRHAYDRAKQMSLGRKVPQVREGFSYKALRPDCRCSETDNRVQVADSASAATGAAGAATAALARGSFRRRRLARSCGLLSDGLLSPGP
jgi:hypothetical protein